MKDRINFLYQSPEILGGKKLALHKRVSFLVNSKGIFTSEVEENQNGQA